MALLNKYKTPLIPDQESLTGDSYRVLTAYFDRYKNDPTLIRKIYPDKPLTPFNAVFMHNPALDSLSSNIEIVDINNQPFDRAQSFIQDSERIFQQTYNVENAIPISNDNELDSIYSKLDDTDESGEPLKSEV